VKITKTRLKQLIKEELIAIHERAVGPEQDDGTVDGSWLKGAHDWLKKKGDEPKRAGAERGGQSKAVPGQVDSVAPATSDLDPGPPMPWPQRVAAVRKAEMASRPIGLPVLPGELTPEEEEAYFKPRAGGIYGELPQRVPTGDALELGGPEAEGAAQPIGQQVPHYLRQDLVGPEDDFMLAPGREWVHPKDSASMATQPTAPPLWSSHTQNAAAVDAAADTDVMAPDAASAGSWKPGMPKPKLPKNWRTLSYKDPRRAAFRDWYKYIKSKRKARERRKARARRRALADVGRDAATLPLSDQTKAMMGYPSAGTRPNVRVPPVDPYDPMIDNKRLSPVRENKITIDFIKELILEVLSDK